MRHQHRLWVCHGRRQTVSTSKRVLWCTGGQRMHGKRPAPTVGEQHFYRVVETSQRPLHSSHPRLDGRPARMVCRKAHMNTQRRMKC